MDLKIENMTCGGCAKSVTKAIQSVDSAAKIETNPAARAVKVETTATPSARRWRGRSPAISWCWASIRTAGR